MAAPRTKLFVGHLPDGVTNDELQTLFERYGTVKECDVINKYGFVHMSTSEEAEDAIKALNGYSMKGSSLSVERSKSKLHPEPGAPGRAKGGMMPSFRGGRGGPGGFSRGGRGGYSNGNGYPRFNDYPYGGRMDPYDRYGGGMAPRPRPYASPYDRPSMGREDPYSRYSPYSAPSRDPYARDPLPQPPRDLYERRPTSYPSTNDYLYSRRSPPAAVPSRAYRYEDAYDSPRGLAAAERAYY